MPPRLSIRVIVPVCSPPEAQDRLTVRVRVEPGLSETGSEVVIENAGLVELKPVMVKLILPVFITVKVVLAFPPKGTQPKSKLVVESWHTGSRAVVAGLGAKALRSGLAPAKTKAATVRMINCLMASSLPFSPFKAR